MPLPLVHGKSNINIKCRHCSKYFHPQGITGHEKKCLPVFTPRSKTSRSGIQVLSSSESTPGEELELSARFEFPKMLYKMLEDCTFDDRHCKIVSWQPHGLAFKVHNRDELDKILSQWFREKYESFRCLLEQWGFLKLSRGKDRGCWYHKMFYHQSNLSRAQKIYGNIQKEIFVEAMPEYLSFRDEPDLEKESLRDNRISPIKKKKILNLSLEKGKKRKNIASQNKNILGSSKEKVKLADDKYQRYRLSTLKECRYCHELFTAQGFSRHEEACRVSKKRKKLDENNSGDDYDDDSDRNTLRESDDDKIDTNSDTDSEDSLELESNNTDRVLHERACKRSPSVIEPNTNKNSRESDNRDNHKGSVLSDDSSVDSVVSSCRICGFNDDHANVLLCEGCDAQVHTYCLTPPLEKIPTGDWFCDSCKLRMAKAEEELGSLIKSVPPEMVERFGEVCFAKSAENAHWWPALIFDPRSFLHNREVVALARRNLGKRYLVFFFENHNAFASIPKRWIVTWDKGVEKEYDKGKSVRNASKRRKQQFERAMDLADEAFEDLSSSDSESGETEFYSTIDSDIEEDSLSFRIPRVIGGISSIFDLCPDFNWKVVRDLVHEEIANVSPSEYPENFEPDNLKFLSRRRNGNGKWQAQLKFGGKKCYLGLFVNRCTAAFAVYLFQQKLNEALTTFEKSDTLAPRPVFRKASGRKKAIDSAEPLSFGTFTDKKPLRRRIRSVAKANKKLQIDNLHQKAPPEPPPKKTKNKLDTRDDNIDSHAKITPPPPPLLDHERNELLLNTPFCYYYLLPLSEL